MNDQKTEANKDGRTPALAVSTCSARLPFKLTLYDGAGKEKTVGPLWLDVPNEGAWEPVPEDFPGGHWEHVARMEKWAKGQLLQDVDCSIDIDALIAPLNIGSEPRPPANP